MQAEAWNIALAAGAVGTGAGLVLWLAGRAALAVVERLPWPRPAFPHDVLRDAGTRERERLRRLGRELALLWAAFGTAAAVAVVAAVLQTESQLEWLPLWAWVVAAAIAAGLLGLGVYGIVRLVLARRRLRFVWAAKVAAGNVLKRLNFSGNRVFHEVTVEGCVIDHVVVGTRGVFAVNVVARRLPKNVEARPGAELRNGKLWLAGYVEALPVGDAARNMTLLSAALSRVVGHRVPVRSVLAVPGWHTVPDGAGNHLVLNENNLPTLTSWNTPDAYLMEEDCLEAQKFLAEASRAARAA